MGIIPVNGSKTAGTTATNGKTLERKQVLYEMGTHATHVYRVHRGAVMLLMTSPQGYDAAIDLVKTGGVFGDEVLFNTSRKTHAIATRPTTVEVMPLTFENERELMRQSVERLHWLSSLWAQTTSGGGRGTLAIRLAHILIRHSGEWLGLGVEDVAQLANSTRESAGRCIGAFLDRADLITTGANGGQWSYRNPFTVHNPEGLLRYAETLHLR